MKHPMISSMTEPTPGVYEEWNGNPELNSEATFIGFITVPGTPTDRQPAWRETTTGVWELGPITP